MKHRLIESIVAAEIPADLIRYDPKIRYFCGLSRRVVVVIRPLCYPLMNGLYGGTSLNVLFRHAEIWCVEPRIAEASAE